jgi:flap endonuclease-1
LIDVGILIGTDFNDGVKGIGPKKALKLVAEFGSIDSMPADIRESLGQRVQDIREIFLNPDVTDDYAIRFAEPDLDGIVRFLCVEREFSRERVTAALERTFSGKSRDGSI